MFSKKSRFDRIVKDIKEIKVQGARNIAKAALKAYLLVPTRKSKEVLLNSRPTEPMMENVLSLVESGLDPGDNLEHFDYSQYEINNHLLKLIKNNSKLYTHCHSSNVTKALIYAHKHGKRFEVFNTETRPLFQGRKTAEELRKAGIKVTLFIDSAMGMAIERENRKDKIYANQIFIGADALMEKGIINKIGSKLLAEISKIHKIPLYIVADSWKYTNQNIPIEQRSINEVWDKAPREIKIKNPAFEFVDKKYIAGIITELGLMKYDDFVKKMRG